MRYSKRTTCLRVYFVRGVTTSGQLLQPFNLTDGQTFQPAVYLTSYKLFTAGWWAVCMKPPTAVHTHVRFLFCYFFLTKATKFHDEPHLASDVAELIG